MGLIFISHSSANNAQAIAIRDWLIENGWNDIFLDLDPQRGLAAGQRWQEELRRAAERCELVIFLISPEWASSQWCVAEFLVAKQINKQIFGVIVEPTPIASLPVELTAEYQVVDLTAGRRDTAFAVTPPAGDKVTVAFAAEGLDRLRIGLRKGGLDPSYFAWPPEDDPERSPYRGLRALEADDAGVFFGRDGSIVSGLDQLRGMREPGAAQMLVILGASGSGKSSFMRAGLLPRLARDDLHFLPLPVVRPERAALTGEHGLVAALEAAFAGAKIRKSRADIRAAVTGGGDALRDLLGELAATRQRTAGPDGVSRPPTVVIAIDQAEELFHADGGAEAGALLSLVREAVNFDMPSVIALISIRSDSYERLQTAPQLEGVRRQFLDLPPMPGGAFGEVIKGPTRRLADTNRPLRVDDQLVDALLRDIEGDGIKDALPLLAFTLERLYREYGGDGDLRLGEYEALGRIKGSIEAAVESALKIADSNPAIPRDREARIKLLRRGLIPWLTGIDPDTGAVRRRVARMSEIPPEARPLIDLLIEQRLLSTDVDRETKEVTVEPAHEALLRQWGLIEGWMEEDLPLLTTLEGVRRATRDWAANAKNPEWIGHAGKRLADAETAAAREDLGNFLQPTERSYLIAARAAETEKQRREIGSLRRQRIVAAAAAVVLALAAGGMYWLWTVAEASFRQASASLGVVQSQTAFRDGDIIGAVASALGAMATLDTAETRSAAFGALMELSPNLAAIADTGGATGPIAWTAPGTIAYATADAVRFADAGALADAASTSEAGVPFAVPPKVLVPATGGGLTVIGEDGSVTAVDGARNATVAMPPVDGTRLVIGQHAAAASGDGSAAATALVSGVVLVRTCAAPGNCTEQEIETRDPSAVAMDSDGGAVAVANEAGVIAFGGGLGEVSLDARIVALDLSDISGRIVAGTSGGDIAIVDPAGPAVVARQTASDKPVLSARWSPAADEFAFICGTTNLCAASVDDGGAFATAPRMFGDRAITGFAWSPDGTRLASVTDRGVVRIWTEDQNRDVRTTLPTGRDVALRSVAASADGGAIAAGDASGGIWIWTGDSTEPRRIAPPDGVRAAATSLAWSNGGFLAAAYDGEAIAIFAPDGALVRAERIARGAVFNRVAFVGESAAAPLRDGRVAIIPANAALPPSFLGPLVGPMEIWGIAGHPDGERVFVSTTDGALRVWNLADPATPVELVTAEAAGADAKGGASLTFSPDGRWVAVTRADNAIVIYDTTGASEPRRVSVEAAGTNVVAFSPDGARLAALSGDGKLYLWDVAGAEPALVLSVGAVPDRSEAGIAASGARRAAWLAWAGNDRLAIPTVSGTVEVLVLDPAGWRARAAGLGIVAEGG